VESEASLQRTTNKGEPKWPKTRVTSETAGHYRAEPTQTNLEESTRRSVQNRAKTKAQRNQPIQQTDVCVYELTTSRDFPVILPSEPSFKIDVNGNQYLQEAFVRKVSLLAVRF